MTLTVRLPPRVEEELKRYCVTRRLTKSQVVKEALEQLLARSADAPTPYELGAKGFGADTTGPRDVARNTKRLLRERFGAKARR
jgi:hypothetical protein